jgi:serine/threonine protein phosphatase PrpC
MRRSLAVTVGNFSDAGPKSTNDDSLGVTIPDERLIQAKGIAAAIADGISSSERGKEAAETCVRGFLADYFSTPDTWSVKHSAHQVLTALNSWLYRHGHSDTMRVDAFISTLSVLILKSTTAHIVHVGDTRICRLRQGAIEQLTTDHRTWVSNDKTYLSRAMGADTHVELDYRRAAVEVGDIFILSSDGVHDYVDTRTMVQLIHDNSAHLNKAAELIVRTALSNSSLDNVTCQIVRVDALPSQNPDDVFKELTELPFPPDLNEGMIVDGYRVLREIHSSQRTQLYLVADTETGLNFVLKTPSVNYADDPAYIERFILEEWIGRRINNPHVVKVYSPSRRRRFLYHVTEYLSGGTLRQWMRDHPEPSLSEVRDIVDQISKGLRAFHRMEMIHQDLKPENIMIDHNGTVKLVDFGSVRVAGIVEIATPVERVNLLGTRNYAAPEYAKDRPGSYRSDIFSLGVIGYEMLTGRLPYGEMSSNWTHENPLKGRRYIPATKHRGDIPDWFDAALRKSVHADPDKRQEALSEFMHDLNHPNSALLAKQQPPLIERNPVVFWQASTALLALLVTYLLYLLSR